MARVKDIPVAVGVAPGSGCSVVTVGNGALYETIITIDTTLPAIAGGANLGIGRLIATLPDGALIIHGSKIDVAIKQTQGNITADTPVVGLGTVIASGAVALLSGTATFQNIMAGQVATNCNGTPTLKTIGTQLVIEASAAHTVHLNVADGWAASGDTGARLTGTVVLLYSVL
jgi:hypothetical protein